ncbi:MAG TPA: MarC family protein [Steroidobacteraceae bacterium]|nr:MarC family protein [Steroidobacteraceae bacterium]
MNGIVKAFLLTFVGLFPIVNPLESAPFFLGLTAGLTSRDRRDMAVKVAINGTLLLLGSLILGPYLLEFFGIELPVVRIAGGLVVTAIGWKLLNQEQSPDHAPGNAPDPAPRRIGSFYPLTMPLTVGPGSMSVAIAIGSHKSAGVPVWSDVVLYAVGAVAGIVAIGVSIYLCYRFAPALARVLGSTGLDVMVRLSAFILMCIGIGIIWSGYTALAGVH